MLTSKWIVALLMLFLLTPVSKLIRRFIFAMVEQFDRGDPATEAQAGAKAGALKTMGTIAAAGAVGVAGVKGIKDSINRGKNNSVKGGNTRPTNVGGKTNGIENSANGTGGYLPETRQANSGSSPDSSSSDGPTNGSKGNSLIDSHGKPIKSKGAIESVKSSGRSQATSQETSSPSVRTQANAQLTVFDRAGKWGRASGKLLAVTGGIASTAVGMGVAAVAGSQMGHAVARHGTQLSHQAGKISGGAVGGMIHGGHRAVQHTVSGYQQARVEGQGIVKAMGRGTHQAYQKAEGRVVDQFKSRNSDRNPAFTSSFSSTVSGDKGINSGFHMNDLRQPEINTENQQAGWQQFVMGQHKKSDDDIPFDD